MDNSVFFLTWLVFCPAFFALLVLPLVPRGKDDLIRWITLFATVLTFVPALVIVGGDGFQVGVAQMQSFFNVEWIPSFDIQYMMGLDGISLPLVLLTLFVSLLAMGASWNITKHVKAYCMLFLLLETGMIGVFLALDFFLFYVFWEVMLLPMYFLIGVWGGPRREYAAIKFFLYTLFGSVLMLIAILILYFNSDLRVLTEDQLAAARITDEATVAEISSSKDPVHTFNILALQQLGQITKADLVSQVEQLGLDAENVTLFHGKGWLGKSLQWWSFLLLFIGFAIKVPSVPLHTWLPDAHVEAPTPISMILAGVLLKMGGYGILRICYPICPQAGLDLMWFVCIVGVVSMVYGAFAALAQKDFKRMVAYSSVSHMGYVVLGFGVWSALAHHNYNPDYWKMGMNGAMFQMIAHGISSAGMFFMVGVIYDRVHHRNLNEFGGLFGKMPVYSGMAFVIFFAGLGLPGLCGFIGEVLVVLSVWSFSKALAVISAGVVILTAAYILWALQRVYLGPEYKGPHGDALTPITLREASIALPLVVMAIALGVYPRIVFDGMAPTVNQTASDLAEWTRRQDASQAATGEAADPQQAQDAARRDAAAAGEPIASVARNALAQRIRAPAPEPQLLPTALSKEE